MFRGYKYALLFLINIAFFLSASAQGTTTTIIGQQGTPGEQYNPIRTAVPLLTIAPDARSAGMGDVGAATDPDAASQHWNPAKYVFMNDELGVHVAYIPWLRNLVPDINLAYLSGFYKVSKDQVISSSLRYFSLGTMIFTDNNGTQQGQFNPNEWAIDAGYSRLFSNHFSGGITFRFIYSDFGRAYVASSGITRPATSFAADIAWYYVNNIQLSDKRAKLSFGMCISNMGSKISYTTNQTKDYLPTNLRLGSSLKTYIDDYNTFGVSCDLNKLLVPTPTYDSAGNYVTSTLPMLPGMINSLYAAPGGWREKIEEIQVSAGGEYGYRDQFFLRGGYFYENQYKGNRKYFEMGVGLKYNMLMIDFAYMIPTSGRTSPLANTMQFSVTCLLGNSSPKHKR